MKTIIIENDLFVLDDVVKVSLEEGYGGGIYNYYLSFGYKHDSERLETTHCMTESQAKQTIQKIMEILEKPLDK